MCVKRRISYEKIVLFTIIVTFLFGGCDLFNLPEKNREGPSSGALWKIPVPTTLQQTNRVYIINNWSYLEFLSKNLGGSLNEGRYRLANDIFFRSRF